MELRVSTLHHLVDYFGTAIIQVQIIIVSFLCVSSLSLVISLFYMSHTRSDVLLSLSFSAISLCLLFFCFCCHCPSSYPCLGGGRLDPLGYLSIQYSTVCVFVCVCVCERERERERERGT